MHLQTGVYKDGGSSSTHVIDEIQEAYRELAQLEGQPQRKRLKSLLEGLACRDAAAFPEHALHLAKLGVIDLLLYWENWDEREFLAQAEDIRGALETLEMMLSLNPPVAELVGAGAKSKFYLGQLIHIAQTLLPPKSFLPACTALHALLCLLHIIPVCHPAREHVVNEAQLMRAILMTLYDGKHSTSCPWPVQRLCLEFLYAVCHGSGIAQRPDGPHRESICAVCLTSTEGCTGVWGCPCCFNTLHGRCAGPWFSKSSSCPYCRCLVICASVFRVLCLLQDARVRDDPQLKIMASLLAVHLVTAQPDGDESVTSELVDVLRKQDTLADLSSALKAASAAQPWPPGSTAFPVPWRLAVGVSHLARLGCFAELESAIEPLAVVALGVSRSPSKKEEGVRRCRDALVALVCGGDNADADMIKKVVEDTAKAQDAKEGDLQAVREILERACTAKAEGRPVSRGSDYGIRPNSATAKEPS
eukprot:gnl/MRDRNA2_/MRDRNA2_28151_c0_seq1.p1 gnl/MRDRNA2_/MRDRNA2_28151_c0~~gnl/MRDRNA2_/MRDRNA2_28151_c0_seq1.p1  ORF type:complete len:475 (+),score=81.09 gnl/MRDRNA2_/MRDRNA2_28151_c0_seq1:76-1500(+)